MQQEADRTEPAGLSRRRVARTGWPRAEAGGKIRPSRRDERPRAVRQHQRQMQNASSVRHAVHGQELALQRMAWPNDRDLLWEVMDVGSV